MHDNAAVIRLPYTMPKLSKRMLYACSLSPVILDLNKRLKKNQVIIKDHAMAID